MDTSNVSYASSIAAAVVDPERELSARITSLIDRIKTLPGGAILIRYIQSSYQDDPIRTVIEIFLMLFAVRYFFSKKTSPDSKEAVPLSEKEIDELCKQWKPRPLAEPVTEAELYKLKKIPVLAGAVDKKITISGENYLDYNRQFAPEKRYDVEGIECPEPPLEDVLNLASLDFLNLSHDPRLLEIAANIIKNHGVGACGPPGFFGNQDVHIRLEQRLAEWYGVDSAIVYGQDYCTPISILPTFLKRGDIAIVDAGCSLAIQKGLLLSRCQVVYFEHRNYEHLANTLEELQEELQDIKPLNRRVIVSEGLFANTGDFADVPKLVEIKKKYKFRLFLDESLSVGSIGPHGRGVADYYGVPASDIDILTGSLANSLASSGGFCVGEKPMIFYQRIASAAYCFSASLAPYSVRVANEVIDMLEQNEGKKDSPLGLLNKNSALLHGKFSKNRKISKYLDVVSESGSPVVILEFNKAIKNKLGFYQYYYNENNKTAQAHEKGMRLFEQSGTAAAAKPSSKKVSESKKSFERVDYYSDEAVAKMKSEASQKAIAESKKKSQADIHNLEEFLISKIVNKLMLEDKMLIGTSQRLLKMEVFRVRPVFKICLSSDLSTKEIDSVVEKLANQVAGVVDNIKCLEDVEKLNSVKPL